MAIAAVLGFVAFWIAMRVRVARRQVRLEAGTFAGLTDELMSLDIAHDDRSARVEPKVWGEMRLAA